MHKRACTNTQPQTHRNGSITYSAPGVSAIGDPTDLALPWWYHEMQILSASLALCAASDRWPFPISKSRLNRMGNLVVKEEGSREMKIYIPKRKPTNFFCIETGLKLTQRILEILCVPFLSDIYSKEDPERTCYGELWVFFSVQSLLDVIHVRKSLCSMASRMKRVNGIDHDHTNSMAIDWELTVYFHYKRTAWYLKSPTP